MKNISALMSHKTDDWKTPSIIYESFINAGFIDCFKFKSDYNEFIVQYFDQKLFVNPPFSKLNKIPEWVEGHLRCNNFIALLIPSRTDTIYFHQLLALKPHIYIIKGRLHYNDSSKCAPFPTLLLTFCQGWSFCTYSSISVDELITELLLSKMLRV